MRLTAWEEERLLVFSASELARRRRERGLRLSAPEAIAIICDALFEAARDGASYEAVVAAGASAVAPEDVLDGVRELVDEIRLEVLLADGTRLIVLDHPIGGRAPLANDGPGAIVPGPGRPAATGVERRRLDVRNTSRRVVRVSSHFPFERVNPRLTFDRSLAAGFHLDLPAGASERWLPGETKEVDLVRCGRVSEPREGVEP